MKKSWRLPFVGDLWDRSAAKNAKTSTALDTLKVLVPAALACANSLSEATAKFLGQGPIGSVITTTAPSLLLAMASVYVICKKVRTKSVLAEGTSLNVELRSYPTYVYPQGIRITAKIVLLPLISLFGVSARPILPNVLVGHKEVGGFICDAANPENSRIQKQKKPLHGKKLLLTQFFTIGEAFV